MSYGTGTVKAKQLTASGLIVDRRCLFRQLLVCSSSSNDNVLEFYDLTSAPVGGEPHYTFDVYGKGMFTVTMAGPGVLFDDGVYVTIGDTGITVTVLYEEV